MCALFFIGAFAMRGAGCTWNDILDRDLDAKVERTRSRPIPSGQVSVRAAAVFLVLQALVGLVVLLQFNRFTILTGIASLAIVAVYPFMKRVTWWPQIVLGLAFSWGALMGWAAVFGRLDAPALLLYAGSIAWVIGYDTIYAHQDREDDALIGVKSTARLFGAGTRPALVCLLQPRGRADRLAGGVAAGAGALFAVGLIAVRGASWLAGRAHRYRRSGSLPAAVQVEPRRRVDPVRGLVRGRAVPVVFRVTSVARDDLALVAMHERHSRFTPVRRRARKRGRRLASGERRRRRAVGALKRTAPRRGTAR